MPSVSYDGQSFQVNGRRIWLCGASLPYAQIPPQEWKSSIASVAEAGFNIVETAAPWLLHEKRPGKFDFANGLDIRRFIELCADAGLRVFLRAGPSIGGTIDGGGLPPWLAEIPGIVMRQGNEAFLERASLFYHKLLEPLADLQATLPTPRAREGGPLLMVQIEHAWHCANDEQGRKYLQELVRYVRECGITVPLLSANDLWQDVEGTIETWHGSKDLLANLRQLRTVQAHAPRLVTGFDAGSFELWGHGAVEQVDRDAALVKFAQIFAAGGQPFVTPFHPGANFGFLGGRLAGATDRYVCTRAAVDAPLDEAGRRGTKFAAIKRLASFATSFGHVFAELDPDYHPIAVDVESVMQAARTPGKNEEPPPIAVVPLHGPQGRIVFVFAPSRGASAKSDEGTGRTCTLLLENGVRMPVQLGDQPVGWYVLDVDLLGNGHLDFCNLCPYALIDRTILVLQGPAKAPVYLSINDGPLSAVVPTGAGAPLSLEHKGITLVICNQEQIDATYHDGEAVYVGCAGFDADGRPILAAGFQKVFRVAKGGESKPAPYSPPPKASPAPALVGWMHATMARFASGESQRFATLDGPASLAACGAPYGYGWYRVKAYAKAGKTKPASKRRILHAPHSGDRLHLYMDGKLDRILGTGPSATPPPWEMKVGPDTLLTFLADNLGRFANGNDSGERKGLPASIYELAPMRGVKPKRVDAAPADPFKVRGFIAGHATDQFGGTAQMQWTFHHRRKDLLAVVVRGLRTGGTLVLNGQPIAYYAGASGGMASTTLIDPATTKGFKPGQNHLRFSPDPPRPGVPADEDVAKAIGLYEVVRDLGTEGQWSFARWEPPTLREFKSEGRPAKGVPSWWRNTFSVKSAAPLWFTTTGLSKGAVSVNGHSVGRYFNCTSSGKVVGPSAPLYIPAPWLRTDGENELFLFDEHGFAPSGARLLNDGRGK